MRTSVAAVCLMGCLLGACSSTRLSATPAATTTPTPSAPAPLSTTAPIPTGAITPANFVSGVNNPLFPLTPGTKLVYNGKKDGEPAVQTLVVLTETKTVLGVTCVSVEDSLAIKGHVDERVVHWYAQDVQGNVWYFGEADEQFDSKGRVVGHDGSWQAGLYGAQPGIVMAAIPQVGAQYRQEYYKGHVEDQFTYTDLSVAVTVPYGSFADSVKTKEFTRLEAGAVDYKYYARGVGLVKEDAGGSEGFALVQVSHT